MKKVKVWCDGSCQNGEIGAGIVIDLGDHVKRFGYYLGRGTSSQAEVMAAIKGLLLLDPDKDRNVEVFVDNMNVYRVLKFNRNYKADAFLWWLLRGVRDNFRRVVVFRDSGSDRMREADELAKRAARTGRNFREKVWKGMGEKGGIFIVNGVRDEKDD